MSAANPRQSSESGSSGELCPVIVLITKVGSEMGGGKKGLKAAYIAEAVEASLRRLQTDYLDVYLSHWHDPNSCRAQSGG